MRTLNKFKLNKKKKKTIFSINYHQILTNLSFFKWKYLCILRYTFIFWLFEYPLIEFILNRLKI